MFVTRDQTSCGVGGIVEERFPLVLLGTYGSTACSHGDGDDLLDCQGRR